MTAETPKERRRLLNIARMLIEDTDEEHGLTMNEIIERLGQLGIPSERKSIYRDIKALREVGLDIYQQHRAPAEYGLRERQFTLEELSLMVDAVQSSLFLTDRRSNQIVKKIYRLASSPQQGALKRIVHVEGRVRTQDSSAIKNVNAVQRALGQRRKIAFTYYDYAVDGTRTPRKSTDGKIKHYLESPLRVTYSDGRYYMLSYNAKHKGIAVYRIDRMRQIAMTDEPAADNETTRNFSGETFANRSFSMYGGNPLSVTFLVDAKAVNAFVDRFGSHLSIEVVDEGHARIVANVLGAPTFYGWVAQFGDQVRIEKPQALADDYCAWLRTALAVYE